MRIIFTRVLFWSCVFYVRYRSIAILILSSAAVDIDRIDSKIKTKKWNRKQSSEMAFAAARMILKDKRRKSKEEYVPPTRTRSKVWFENCIVVCSFPHRINIAFVEKVLNLIVRETARKKMYRIHKVWSWRRDAKNVERISQNYCGITAQLV